VCVGLQFFSRSAAGSPPPTHTHGAHTLTTAHPHAHFYAQTYGEDPHLLSEMGRTFTLALQNRTNGFLQVASMSRHFLGFHGATDLPNSGEEWVSPQWLADQHLPAYRALMVDGGAEAVMCSCNTLRVGPGDGAAGGIPACVHPLLYDILRTRWNSTALVQADNEAIFPMWQSHHYYKSLQEAVVGALQAGVAAVDSGGGGEIVAALGHALGNGSVSLAQVDAMVERQMLMRLRVGEFDTENAANPFRLPYDEAQLDGPAHRALAREAVVKSATLLRNAAPPGSARALLPLSAPPTSIAVIGPWADAGNTRG
jgi:beta-glucosidase